MVAFLQSVLPFDRFVDNLVPDDVRGIHMVLLNSCGQAFTYALEGNRVSYKNRC